MRIPGGSGGLTLSPENEWTPIFISATRNFGCWRLLSFFLCGRTSCAKLRAMVSIYSGRNKRAHISIAVYLRLTRMDVCCGPPVS